MALFSLLKFIVKKDSHPNNAFVKNLMFACAKFSRNFGLLMLRTLIFITFLMITSLERNVDLAVVRFT